MAETEIKEVFKDTYVIQDRITYCYFVIGKEKALVIDTAFGSYDIKALVKEVSDLPVVVVNTHGHPDHMGGNNQFDKVFCHVDEFVNEIELAGDGVKTPWELVGLKDGDVIDLGERQLEVIHIPGHSPGSIALLDKENRLLFSGDTLQTGPVFLFVPRSDISTYINSLDVLAKRASEYDVVYPAHNLAPVDASYIEDLKKLACDIRDGKIEPVSKQLIHDMPCATFKAERVSINY